MTENLNKLENKIKKDKNKIKREKKALVIKKTVRKSSNALKREKNKVHEIMSHLFPPSCTNHTTVSPRYPLAFSVRNRSHDE